MLFTDIIYLSLSSVNITWLAITTSWGTDKHFSFQLIFRIKTYGGFPNSSPYSMLILSFYNLFVRLKTWTCLDIQILMNYFLWWWTNPSSYWNFFWSKESCFISFVRHVFRMKTRSLDNYVTVVHILLWELFCLCVSALTFPSSWKNALIQPVPKEEDHSQLSNYHPMALN